MKRLAVVFNNSAPYFRARLRAAGSALPLVALPLRGDEEIWEQARNEEDPYTLRPLLQENDSPTPSRIARVVHEALDREKPDVVAVHGWSRRCALSALAWCCRRRVPAVMLCDFQAVRRKKGDLSDAIRHRLLRCCSAVLTAGQTHAEQLVRWGVSPERIRTGFDVVDNSHFTEGAADARRIALSYRKRLDLPQNYFICISRLSPEKNLGRLLEAYAQYRREVGKKAWKLVVAGDGPLFNELTLRIHHMELREHVTLAGTYIYRVMPAVYGLARAFVLASTHEAWGISVNEAMAAGLPIFVSDHVSCGPDLVRSGENGYVFEALKPETLTHHLVKATRGEYDLSVMGRASLGLISEWTVEHFSTRLCETVDLASARPVKPSRLDSSLASILVRRPGAPN